MDEYAEDGLVPSEGAPTPDVLWMLSTYNPMFFVGLMAKFGYTQCAWKAIKNYPQQIRPYVPPRPIPVYIGFDDSWAGSFEGQSSPEFH
jgi:hypothetical protein